MLSFTRLAASAALLFVGAAVFSCAQDASNLSDDGSSGALPDVDSSVPDTSSPAQDSGSHPPPVDSGQPPPPVDSGQPPPPVDSGSDSDPGPPPDAAPLPNGDCDTSGIGAIVYPAEAFNAVKNGTATPCPCDATHCCFTAICVPR